MQLGFGESSADVRIAQYESGDRKPKKDTIHSLTEILGVSTENFCPSTLEAEFFQFLSWMEEKYPDSIHFSCLGGEIDSEKQTDPVGIYFSSRIMNEHLREWMEQKKKLRERRISQTEYTEWKWNELVR